MGGPTTIRRSSCSVTCTILSSSSFREKKSVHVWQGSESPILDKVHGSGGASNGFTVQLNSSECFGAVAAAATYNHRLDVLFFADSFRLVVRGAIEGPFAHSTGPTLCQKWLLGVNLRRRKSLPPPSSMTLEKLKDRVSWTIRKESMPIEFEAERQPNPLSTKPKTNYLVRRFIPREVVEVLHQRGVVVGKV
jgi:hypothetical protein